MSRVFDRARLEAVLGAEAVGESGVPGLPVVAPGSIEAAREAVRVAAQDGGRLLPLGAGRHVPPEVAQARFDFALSTRRLQRVVEYEPEEMVLVAEAGVSLESIAALAAAHGQRLGPDPWSEGGATVGGAVAADRSGLTRLRYGTWRDALLGARVVHDDARMSKTGGKVVKNVAGYDLGKLYVGSRGTLALVTEVNLRLVPAPPAAAFAVAVVERRGAAEVLLALHRSALTPAALLLVAGEVLPECTLAAGQAAVCVRFEGHAAAVRWQLEQARRIAAVEEWPAERAKAAWEALRRSGEPRRDAVTLAIASLPVAAPAVLNDLVSGPGGVWSEASRFVAQFGVGASHVQLPGMRPLALRALRSRLAACGARLVIQSVPAGDVKPWLATPPLLQRANADLIRRTKSALDPGGRFAPLAVGAVGGEVR